MKSGRSTGNESPPREPVLAGPSSARLRIRTGSGEQVLAGGIDAAQVASPEGEAAPVEILEHLDGDLAPVVQAVAQLRGRLNNGRKVAIQMLEYFDRRGLTLRRGDLRRINPARQDLFARAGPNAEPGA